MPHVAKSFSAPSESTDVVLIVDGKKLHVSKERLAARSPVFAAMFFGDRKKEYEIKGVNYWALVDLLKMMPPKMSRVRVHTVSAIADLADYFGMKVVMAQVEYFLITKKGLWMRRKFQMANRYGLKKLTDHCVKNSKCINRFSVILEKDFACIRFSEAAKVAICEKAISLVRVGACACGSGAVGARVAAKRKAGADMQWIEARLPFGADWRLVDSILCVADLKMLKVASLSTATKSAIGEKVIMLLCGIGGKKTGARHRCSCARRHLNDMVPERRF